MIQTASEASLEALVKDVVKYEELRRAAIRRDDIPAANRHFDKATPLLDELASRVPAGREALEMLLTHSSAFVRLSAAARVLAWAHEKAIPVLAHLAEDDLGADYSPAEGGSVEISAAGLLYRHFDIRSFDRNDLIEPLRAYGIDWPHRYP